MGTVKLKPATRRATSLLFPTAGIIQNTADIQGEYKIFPWLQTFITRKLRGIQTFFYHYL